MTKKIVKRFIGLVLAGMVLVGLFVYLIDPFYHYHKPWFGMEPYLYNTVYQTPGVARNLEYDSVILGSSMTENFRTSWFDDELGWHTVKLSYSGARTNDLAAIMGQIFVDGRNVENVFIDINEYQLTEDYTTAFAERPEYLYDNNIFNDVQYLFNKDVILASCGRVIARIGGVAGNMDSAYCWDGPELFGVDKVKLEYDSVTVQANEVESISQEEMIKSIENCIKNIENIESYIEENPNTQFYFFYPPYSMAYWQTVKESGRLEKTVQLYKTSMECLLQYKNVTLYYFQDEHDFISDLDNYRDLCHYSAEMNRYIFDCVKEDSHRIDINNYQEKLDAMYQLADNYEYSYLWKRNN